MIRSSAIPRTVGKWITIASAIVIPACAPVMLAPGTQYSGEWNTKLPPGVSSSSDAFRTQLRVTPGVKHTRLRAGTCSGCEVTVSIQAIDGPRAFGPGSPPVTGLAVAHIQNLDPRNTEGYYGFRPSTVADYYLWVDKRPDADSTRITVLEVPRGIGPVRAGRQKNLEYCHMYPRASYSLPPDADFVEYKDPCTVGSTAGSSKIVEASFFSAPPFGGVFPGIATALRALATISQGGWIDCNSGCCK